MIFLWLAVLKKKFRKAPFWSKMSMHFKAIGFIDKKSKERQRNAATKRRKVPSTRNPRAHCCASRRFEEILPIQSDTTSDFDNIVSRSDERVAFYLPHSNPSRPLKRSALAQPVSLEREKDATGLGGPMKHHSETQSKHTKSSPRSLR